MKLNVEFVDSKESKEYADTNEVFKEVKQIQWHLEQIKNKNYKISHLDLDDLKEAEDLLDCIVPYYGMEDKHERK